MKHYLTFADCQQLQPGTVLKLQYDDFNKGKETIKVSHCTVTRVDHKPLSADLRAKLAKAPQAFQDFIEHELPVPGFHIDRRLIGSTLESDGTWSEPYECAYECNARGGMTAMCRGSGAERFWMLETAWLKLDRKPMQKANTLVF